MMMMMTMMSQTKTRAAVIAMRKGSIVLPLTLKDCPSGRKYLWNKLVPYREHTGIFKARSKSENNKVRWKFLVKTLEKMTI